jgi:hypothetical protein
MYCGSPSHGPCFTDPGVCDHSGSYSDIDYLFVSAPSSEFITGDHSQRGLRTTHSPCLVYRKWSKCNIPSWSMVNGQVCPDPYPFMELQHA